MKDVVVKVFRSPIRGGIKAQTEAREALSQQANAWIADNAKYTSGVLTAGIIKREKFSPTYLGEEKDYFVIRIYEETKD